MNSDLVFEITKNVNDVKSLVLMCSIDKEMLHMCQKYSKHMFLSLTRNASFRRSFFTTTEQFITTNNFTALMSLMKFYPIGRMFPEQFNYMNEMQHAFIKDISTFVSQPFFATLFQLLFYPTNYITFSLLPLVNCYIGLKDHSLFHDNFFKVLTFHFSHVNQFSKTKVELIGLINHIVSYVSVYNESFIIILEHILDSLFESDKTTLQLTLFGAIIYPIENNGKLLLNTDTTNIFIPQSLDFSIHSDDAQEEYGHVYEYILRWYSKYDLDDVRQKYKNTQTGGSLFSTLVNVAKSPLVQKIGKQVATHLGGPATKQMGKQLATQALKQASDHVIDNATQYVQSKTGINVDNTNLKTSVHSNIQKHSNSW